MFRTSPPIDGCAVPPRTAEGLDLGKLAPQELRDQLETTGTWLFRWRGSLPAVFLIPIVIVLARDPAHPAARLAGPVWEAACLGMVLLGIGGRLLVAGCVPTGTSGRNTRRQRAKSLNTTGIYSVVRHPLYLGNFLIGLGWCLFPGDGWLLALYVALFCVYYERIMLMEEAFLRREFGAAFIDWAQHTPAFVPLTTRWITAQLPFSWRTALRREYLTFCLAIAVLALLRGVAYLCAADSEPIEPRWIAIAAADGILFLGVRSVVQQTTWLNVPGR